MTNNTNNFTFINTVEIFKFSPVNSTIVYNTQTLINRFRDRSNDSQSLGRIGLSVYN